MKLRAILVIVTFLFGSLSIQAKSWNKEVEKLNEQEIKIHDSEKEYCVKLEKSLPYFEKSANLGNVEGMALAGFVYARGVFNCKWSMTGKGSEYTFKACQAGHKYACINLERYGIGY